MSMAYVREQYGVPAKRGMRVSWKGDRIGTITRATHYVYVRFDGLRFSRPFHPTDPGLLYLTTTPARRRSPMPTSAKTQDRIRLFAEVGAVSAGAERKEGQ